MAGHHFLGKWIADCAIVRMTKSCARSGPRQGKKLTADVCLQEDDADIDVSGLLLLEPGLDIEAGGAIVSAGSSAPAPADADEPDKGFQEELAEAGKVTGRPCLARLRLLRSLLSDVAEESPAVLLLVSWQWSTPLFILQNNMSGEGLRLT